MDGTLSEGEVEDAKIEDEYDLFNTETTRPTVFKSMRLPSSRSMIGAINAKCSSEPSLASPSSPRTNFLSDKIEGEDTSTTSSPSKLAISRIDMNEKDAIDDIYPKKLSRGISRATDNVNLVSKARNELAHDFQLSSRGSRVLSIDKGSSLIDAPEYTFTLPDLSIHSPDFAEFLEKDLIEKSSLVSLEGANRLNWWYNQGICQRLLPLATTGDGNCLLHAASLGMWGFHDRLLTLRKALHIILGSTRYSESFYRRWRHQTSISNEAAGLKLCEEEWEKEWNSLLKMSSSEPRFRGSNTATSDEPSTKTAVLSGGKKSEKSSSDFQSNVYESLEEVHILGLAHVLMRPIIVIADTVLKDVTGEPFAPIPFGGIYLPIEIDPSTCYKSPLCLTYDAAHFSALVAIDQETFADKTPPLPTAIPLVDSENKLLPLQFIIDPGMTVDWKEMSNEQELNDESKIILLRKYLDIVEVKNPKAETKGPETKNDSDIKETSGSCEKNVVEEINVEKTEEQGIEVEKSMTLPAQLDTTTSHSGTARSTRSCPAESSPSKSHKNKALQQWRVIRHRFGSLGRSFRKSFRRSYTSLSKRGTSFRKSFRKALGRNKPDAQSDSKLVALPSSSSHHTTLAPSSNNSSTILCAILNTEKRHDYHEEMIRNYLITARIRFLNHQKEKKSSSTSSSNSAAASPTHSSSSDSKEEDEKADGVDSHFASQCVNSGCDSFGTSETSYLCLKCFNEQKKEMMTNIASTNIDDRNTENTSGGDRLSSAEELAQLERQKLGSCENLISSSYTSPSLTC